MKVFRRTFAYFKPFWVETLFGLILSACSIALGLLKPWPIKFIIDGILGNPKDPGAAVARQQLQDFAPGWTAPALIGLLCLALVLIHFSNGLVELVKNFIFTRVGLKALLKLRTELYSYLQSLSLKFHDQRRSSDSSFRVAYDSQSVQTIYAKGIAGVFGSVVTLIGAFVIMIGMDWKLTLISLGVLPFVVLAIRYFAVKIKAQSTTIHERESAVLATVQEGLSSVRMVHAFGREDFEVNQLRHQAEQSLAANLRLNVTNVASTLVVGTLMSIGTAAMYFIGANQVLQTTLTIGDLIVFAAYLQMLYGPLESLTYTAWAMQGAAAGAQRCFEVLDKEDEIKEIPNARTLPPGTGTIVFENVCFGYRPDVPILHDINLEALPGQTLAFVGGTGAGKSTLLSLVPRFYDVTAGRVLVGGEDVRELTKASLRSQIGIVLQDTLLFSTTVLENIAYGKPGATFDEIVEAAKRAQAHDFIEKMPEGYRSPVGERGNRLSVGQRQRIGIARAFLKDSPILLLDEPTSALDATTERAIMETIEELMQGRTTLIITHRISTIHHLDQIYVLKNGRIAERGRGAELAQSGGAYAELYSSAHYVPKE